MISLCKQRGQGPGVLSALLTEQERQWHRWVGGKWGHDWCRKAVGGVESGAKGTADLLIIKGNQAHQSRTCCSTGVISVGTFHSIP